MDQKMLNDYYDDPIRLFDSERTRVLYGPGPDFNEVEDIEDPGFLINEDCCQNNIDIEKSSRNGNSSILPATFYDIQENVRLLKECCPLFIKLVDYKKFPWYEGHNVLIPNHTFHTDYSDTDDKDFIETIVIDDDDTTDIINLITVDEVKPNNVNTSTVNFNETVNIYSNDSLQSNNNIDLKNNKGIVGLKISQSNLKIHTDNNQDFSKVVTNTSSKNDEISDICQLELYARMIERSYQNLKTIIKYKQLTSDSGFAACGINPNVYKNIEKLITRIDNNNKILISQSENNNNISTCDDSTIINTYYRDIESANSIVERLEPKVLNKDQDKIDIKFKENPVEDKKSRSPHLLCLLKSKTITQNKNKKSVTILKSNKKCNKLFNSNRIIPHYHKHFTKSKAQIPVNLLQNVITQSHMKSHDEKNMQIQQINCVSCKSLERINFTAVKNGTYKQKTSPNTSDRISKYKGFPICPMNNSNLDREYVRNFNLITKETAEHRPTNVPVVLNHNFSNNVPVLLNHKANNEQKTTEPIKTFPMQSIVRNRDINTQSYNFNLSQQKQSCDVSIVSLSDQNDYNNTSSGNVNNTNINLHANYQTTPNVTLIREKSHDKILTKTVPQSLFNKAPVRPLTIIEKILNKIPEIELSKNVLDQESNNFITKPIAGTTSIIIAPNTEVDKQNLQKYPNLKQASEQPQTKTNNSIVNNNFNNNSITNNKHKNTVVVAVNKKGYSPAILPILSYQKSYEIFTKKHSEFEHDKSLSYCYDDFTKDKLFGSTNEMKEPQKRKYDNNTETIVRKISIGEYKKRLITRVAVHSD